MKMMTTTLKRSAEWYFVERMSVAQRNGGLSAIPPIPSIREDMAELYWEPSLVRSDNIPVAVYVVHRHVLPIFKARSTVRELYPSSLLQYALIASACTGTLPPLPETEQ